ncbi:hypothetical protein B9479_002001 [Cryptococcus floricola]|uniref:Mitochondrial import receptor subunit TOM20 n=1 Tax=Cryptococcus floricola TaxID=2591691 RepID=A0A5D3B2M5_9TREE|nr:hypothetical protein B9479_002001 [Cryptococcus floricola]
MASISPVRVAGTVAALAATGFLGYAVYFDYQRRNSATFRKSLKKQEKKLAAVAEADAKQQKEKDNLALREGFLRTQLEPVPSSPDQQEAYFAEQANSGELAIAKGPEHYVEAALHFFKALRVYHSPGELLAVYQRVCPPEVLEMVVRLIGLSQGVASSLETPEREPASVNDIDDTPSASAQAKAVEEAKAAATAAVAEAVAESEKEREEEKKEEEEEVSSPKTASQGSGAEWENVNEKPEEESA